MSGFDRIKAPEQRLLERAMQGREGDRGALFSVGETVEREHGPAVACDRCGAVTALGVTAVLRLATPPFAVVPWPPRPLYARCPACRTRGWLRVRLGG